MLLTESKLTEVLTEGLKYHLETKTPLYENIYRPGSEEYFNTVRQARTLMNKGVLTELCFEDIELLFETEVGEYGEYNGKKVPLDFPMLEEAIAYSAPSPEATWKAAQLKPQVVAVGQEEWKKLSSLSKGEGGLGYSIKYNDIASQVQKPTSSKTISFPDDANIQMPTVLKYMDSNTNTVKHELILGADELASLIDSQTDPNPPIWVIDLTQEASLEEVLQHIKEASLTDSEKLELVKKVIKMSREMGAVTDLESLSKIIAKSIKLTPKLAPGEFKVIKEAKYQGKEVALNKPKRGGPKKFYVYTRNPKTGKIIKVNFGDTTGLSAKINNKAARVAFAKRHNCPTKKDKTKAGYWSCRLPRYASLLGLKSSFGGYW